MVDPQDGVIISILQLRQLRPRRMWLMRVKPLSDSWECGPGASASQCFFCPTQQGLQKKENSLGRRVKWNMVGLQAMQV